MLPFDGIVRGERGREGMSNDGRKFGEKLVEFRVDLVADGARRVLELIGGVPTRHDVVRVDLCERYVRRQALLELVDPREADAQRREVAHDRADLVLAHEYGQLFRGFAQQQEERNVQIV